MRPRCRRGRLFFRAEPPSWLPKNCPFEPRWVLLGGSTPLRTPRSAPEGGFSSLTQRPEAFCQHEPRRLMDVPERHEASSSSPPDESAPEPRQKEKRHQRFNQQPQCRHNEPGRRRPSEVCLPSRGPSNVIKHRLDDQTVRITTAHIRQHCLTVTGANNSLAGACV